MADVEARRIDRAELEVLLEEEECATCALADVALEWMYRGDRVEVLVGRGRWVGQVVHVGPDLMTVDLGRGQVDARLSAVGCVRVAEEGEGGRPLESHFPGSIRARLHELWSEDGAAELGGERLPRGLRGVVRLVGRHHIELETNAGNCVVPLDAIEWIRWQP